MSMTIGTPGLGKEIYIAKASGAVAVMYAYVIAAGIIGVGVNFLARWAERLVMPWHVSVRGEIPV